MVKFIKKFLAEIIIVSTVLVGSAAALITINSLSKKDNLIAYIYVRDNLVQQIDLSEANEEETIKIQGVHSEMTIGIKHNAIKVIDGGCPHKDCEAMGWVSNSATPIICAYNQVTINFNSKYDVVI